jgi:hypothetical protein
MKLEFNDLGELNAFINWATHFGREDCTPIGPRVGVDGSVGDVAFGTPQRPLTVSHVSLDDKPPEDGDCRVVELPGDQQGDPAAAEPTPRRKRRTKAEIEADAKATAETPTKPITTTTYTDRTAVTGSGEHPAQSPAQQDAAQPAGANPFEQAVHTGATTEGATNNDEGTATEPEVVTPFQHLTRAREFIAKHGMPKYNESFSKAGLDANVMAYTGYQRALHLAALDELEKA